MFDKIKNYFSDIDAVVAGAVLLFLIWSAIEIRQDYASEREEITATYEEDKP